MRVLFAVSSWGLGHATRDLVLLRALLSARRSVTVLSTGRALRALRQELGDRCDYLDLPDIPAVGQTEQEYLGEVHEARGNLHSVPQRKLDLPRDTAAARGYRGLHRVGCTARTASRFMEILEG